MNLYALTPLFSALALSGFLAYMLAQKTSRLNKIFLALTAALLIWNLGDFFTWTVIPDNYLGISFHLLTACWLQIGLLTLLFVYQIIGKKFDLVLKFLCLTTGMAIVLSVFTDSFVQGFAPTFWGKIIVPGPIYLPLIVIAVFIPLLYSIIMIAVALRQSLTPNIRNSLKLVMYGLTISMTVAIATDVVIPHIYNKTDFIHLGSASAVFFCFFMLLAVNKYKFMSITIEDLARNIFMGNSEGVVILDQTGMIKQINPAACMMLGMDESNCETVNLHQCVVNYDLDKEYAAYETETSTGKSVSLSQSRIVAERNSSAGFLLLINDLTDKKIAQQQLLDLNNELEEKVRQRTAELNSTTDFLESVFNSITDAIMVVDAHGRIVKCNQQFYKLFNYQPEEVRNKIIDMFFSEDELAEFNRNLQELNKTQQFSIETDVLLNSGIENPVYISTSVIKQTGMAKQEDQILIVLSDISKRKNAELKLAESQRLSKLIIDNINESIMVVQDGLIRNFVNSCFSGHTIEDVLNQPLTNFIHPDYCDQVIKHHRARSAGCTDLPNSYQIKILNTQGVYMWADVTAVYTKWEEKDAVLVYLRDISKQKQAEELLVENEKLFRAFIDQANDFILIKSRDGHYLKINRKFSWLIGKTEAEIAGKTPQDLGYSPEFVREVTVFDQQIIESKLTIVRESAARKSKKMAVEWLEETMFPILDESGEVKYIGIISRDITPTKKNEQELFRQNEQLQEAYRKLQESYQIIINQEKLASLGTLAAGMAHEINNPSQAIKFSMQSLKLNLIDLQTFLDECKKVKNAYAVDAKMQLNDILELMDRLDLDTILLELQNIALENEKSVNRINNIIQSTSRLSYQEQEMKPCDMKQIVSDALTLLHSNLKNQLQIEQTVEENLPAVFGIHQQLEQVVINLINNAKDSMEEKGLGREEALLKISLSFDYPANMVRLSVGDNGKGIPAELLGKIYDPFFTTKQLGKGTGLGLNLVHRIVENHSGTISVDSKVDEGTSFVVSLPAA